MPKSSAVSEGVGGGQESLADSLLALAGILFAGRSAEMTLDAVASLAQRTIPGCDAASVTIVDNGKPKTTVSTDELARGVDRHQYSLDQGPCLEAIRSHTVIRVDSFGGESRWPSFIPGARERGVNSSLSLPLIVLDEPVGALNLYSRREAAFAHAEPVGEVFASQAAITLSNATAYHRATELARNLTLALEHRDVIGQAKGILMSKEDVSSEGAFDILRRASHRANRKIYDLAVEIVARNAAHRKDR